MVSRLLGCTASAVQPPVCDAGASLCPASFFCLLFTGRRRCAVSAAARSPHFSVPSCPAIDAGIVCVCKLIRAFRRLPRSMRAGRSVSSRAAVFSFPQENRGTRCFASPGMRFAFLPVQATAGNYTFVPISRTNMPLPAAIHASRVIHRGQATSIPIAPSGAVTRIESTATERMNSNGFQI